MAFFRKSALACVILVMGLPALTIAQELHYISNRVNQTLDANREAARAWFGEVATLSPEVRSAALDLSQYPELVVRLRYVDGPAGVEKLIADSPDAVRPSIKLLSMRPDIVSRMSSQLVATTLAGQVYRGDPALVTAMVDQLNQAAVERSQNAVKGWKDRMVRDATAQQQWQDVRMASPGMPATGGTGDLPSAIEVNRALSNADTYAELAAEIIDQWEAERNPDEYRMAVDLWYAKYHDVLPDSFSMEMPLLVQLVREHARFEKEFAKLGATGTVDRRTMLDTRAAEFPNLIKVREYKALTRLRAKPIRVAGAPWSGSSSGSGSRSSGSGSSSRSSGLGGSTRMSRSGSRSSSSSSDMVGMGGSRSRRGSRSNQSNSNNGSGGSSGGFGGGSGGSGGSGGFGSSGGGFGGGGGGFGGGGGGFGGGSGGSGGFGSSGGSSSFGSGGGSNSQFGGSSSSRFGQSGR